MRNDVVYSLFKVTIGVIFTIIDSFCGGAAVCVC